MKNYFKDWSQSTRVPCESCTFTVNLLHMRAEKANVSLGKRTVSPNAPHHFWLAPPQRTLVSCMLTSKKASTQIRYICTYVRIAHKLSQLVYKKTWLFYGKVRAFTCEKPALVEVAVRSAVNCRDDGTSGKEAGTESL